MKVYRCTNDNGPTVDPLFHFHFEEYENSTPDFNFFTSNCYDKITEPQFKDSKTVVLTLEEPNFCVDGFNHCNIETHADKILTLCPFFAEVSEKRTLVYFPVNSRYIPKPQNKEHDVIYFGSVPQPFDWEHIIHKTMQKFNYIYAYRLAGNVRNVSYPDKMMWLSKCKVALIHGVCAAKNVKRYIDYNKKWFPNQEIGAFKHLNKNYTPQVKSRMFETALARTLMLVRRDDFNVIENWFVPDEDFIYFEDANDLESRLPDIIKNYDNYQNIIENAYNKTIDNYLVENFVKDFLNAT